MDGDNADRNIEKINELLNSNNYNGIFDLLNIKEDFTIFFKDSYHTEVYRQRILFLLKKFGVFFWRNKRILDMGSGISVIGNCLFRLGAKVTALEVRDDVIELGKKLYPNIKFIQYDLESPFNPSISESTDFKEPYDIVLSYDIFDHLGNSEAHILNVLELTGQLAIFEGRTAEKKCEFVNENVSSLDESVHGMCKMLTIPQIEDMFERPVGTAESYKKSIVYEKITKELEDVKLNSPNKYEDNKQRACWVVYSNSSTIPSDRSLLKNEMKVEYERPDSFEVVDSEEEDTKLKSKLEANIDQISLVDTTKSDEKTKPTRIEQPKNTPLPPSKVDQKPKNERSLRAVKQLPIPTPPVNQKPNLKKVELPEIVVQPASKNPTTVPEIIDFFESKYTDNNPDNKDAKSSTEKLEDSVVLEDDDKDIENNISTLKKELIQVYEPTLTNSQKIAYFK